MKNFILTGLAVAATAYFLSGVSILGGLTLEGVANLALVVLTLTIVNMFIKPILSIITLPINIITLGFFSLIINAFLIMLADYILPAFSVDGFLSALLFGIILSVVRMVLNTFDN